MTGIDAIVMGRRTFESVLGFADWPYPRPVAVLSSRPVDVPDRLAGRVFPLSGTPQAIMAEMAGRGHARLYVDGGETVRRFLAAGLIDRMVLTHVPRVLGRGTPLFGPEVPAMALVHERTDVLKGGLVMSRYARPGTAMGAAA